VFQEVLNPPEPEVLLESKKQKGKRKKADKELVAV
jgi:hypothetical protein